MESNFISLESLEIAQPCRANWNTMTGDERARFCQSCKKNVYNLSEMTRDEAMRLIQEKEGHVCVRLHRRADGTVLTSDCPVGQTIPKRAPIARVFMAAMGFVAAMFGLRGAIASNSNDANITAGTPTTMDVEMGAVAPAPTPTPVPKHTRAKDHGNASRTKPSTRAKRISVKRIPGKIQL
ncbi:hypothetical protein IAD21_03883 [Abditibacteriota bacterium]|nr:hypothetical protein IAD21_03883 [Abditibacteriota bacterium]